MYVTLVWQYVPRRALIDLRFPFSLNAANLLQSLACMPVPSFVTKESVCDGRQGDLGLNIAWRIQDKDGLNDHCYHAVLRGLGNAAKISAASLLDHLTKWRKEEAKKALDPRKRVRVIDLLPARFFFGGPASSHCSFKSI